MQLLPASVVLIISLGTVWISASEDDEDDEEEDEADEEEAEAGERLERWASFFDEIAIAIADWVPLPVPEPEPEPELDLLLELEAAGFSGNLMVNLGTTLPTLSSLAARIVSFGTMCGVLRGCWPRLQATSSSAHDEEQEEASASEASWGLAITLPSAPPLGSWMRRGSTRRSSPPPG